MSSSFISSAILLSILLALLLCSSNSHQLSTTTTTTTTTYMNNSPSIVGPPIPSLNDALVLPLNNGQQSALADTKVQLDVWFDLTCSDSADLWNDYFRTLIQYVQSEKLPVQFRIHNYPLPYHIAGYEQLKAYLIVKEYGDEYAYRLMDASFSHQQPIYNENVTMLNQPQIQSVIYDTYVAPLKISALNKSNFLQRMNTREVWDHGRRVFKLATASAVYGTPQFTINGVLVHNTESFTMQDWLNLFKQVIQNY